jgi:Rhodopirellula transposase DDE domain
MWNKIEHRLFSHIDNWRGTSLVGLATIVRLIRLDPTAAQMTSIRPELQPFHGD